MKAHLPNPTEMTIILMKYCIMVRSGRPTTHSRVFCARAFVSSLLPTISALVLPFARHEARPRPPRTGLYALYTTRPSKTHVTHLMQNSLSSSKCTDKTFTSAVIKESYVQSMIPTLFLRSHSPLQFLADYHALSRAKA